LTALRQIFQHSQCLGFHHTSAFAKILPTLGKARNPVREHSPLSGKSWVRNGFDQGMKCMSLKFVSGVVAILAALGLPGLAIAAETLSLETDHTVILAIPAQPGAVIIGNPSIVDASIQAGKLLLHGKSFGTTNIVALDQDGNQMMDLAVSVKHTTPNAVAVFKGETFGATRFSYNCAPLCESTIQIGDNLTYNAVVTDQTKQKSKLATGKEDAKSEAPPAPQ
jgi:hypothetical protein